MKNRKRQREQDMAALLQRQTDSYMKQILAQKGPNAYRAAKQADFADATPPEPPPVFSECIVGFRVWTIDALGRLRPQSVNQRPWVPGINTAACDAHKTGWSGAMWSTGSVYGYGYDPPRPTDHKAPAKGCACGLYARFAVADIIEPEGAAPRTYSIDAATWIVLGSIAAWGDVQVHQDGFRAENACVTALGISDDMPTEVRELVERTAARYKVPAIPLDTLEAEAMMHGTPLPDEARPEPVVRLPLNDLYGRMYNQYLYGTGVSKFKSSIYTGY